MRKVLDRFARRALAPSRPEESLEIPFEGAAQMADAARTFRRYGCRVMPGKSPFALVVTLPRAERSTYSFKIAGGVR